ncbi:MAG: twin-arginine translocase TatA/TatE family subunit [Verrucomicrobiae bacterium]|nr:twin-arginine translocase TatA/TatE family subunit [Verrucomicrobiae bacterium]MDW8343307.1 twin-arginine translocase TatA/TatE family subunit [Verrucomicrobiae bacterium]
MGNIGGWEIFWIVLVVLLLFGAKRIPEMMRSMGQGVKEFKKAARDISSDEEPPATTKPSPPPASPSNSSGKPA